MEFMNRFSERLSVAQWGGIRITKKKMAQLLGVCEKTVYNHPEMTRFSDGRPVQTALDVLGWLEERATIERRKIFARLGLFEVQPSVAAVMGSANECAVQC